MGKKAIEHRILMHLAAKPEPQFHEDIADALNLPIDPVGQALVTLLHDGYVAWPGPAEWEATSNRLETFHFSNGTIKVGVIDHDRC